MTFSLHESLEAKLLGQKSDSLSVESAYFKALAREVERALPSIVDVGQDEGDLCPQDPQQAEEQEIAEDPSIISSIQALVDDSSEEVAETMFLYEPVGEQLPESVSSKTLDKVYELYSLWYEKSQKSAGLLNGSATSSLDAVVSSGIKPPGA
ncbi:MAG: hypothetical protein A2X77_01970 [Gammaproteobacteria bacterium GWE2_42_36]|nr:MAG: hypothetical protein A2X77_01970 [Gammaproteobacteria bacterium GWE2_42_36]